MTISDLIARLKVIMDESGSSAQVKIGAGFDCADNSYDYFEVRFQQGSKDVILIPSNVWDRKSDLKGLAMRESVR